MTDEVLNPEPPAVPGYPDDLAAAVRAAQLAVCAQEVPEALAIRLAQAAAMPPGSWSRNAGHKDPRVIQLEAPYRRARQDGAPSPAKATRRRPERKPAKKAAPKTSGSAGSRSTPKNTKKGN